ncbi:phage major capsid protein [uncultured Algimonas sp.]|uniref:phage major capsid protein n=1 Tax=uncultured Algimonas sp. TaxID=1547920 RepID=UPI0026398133|nr:phage major capsid protein [uncultured Algimonas sp.]
MTHIETKMATPTFSEDFAATFAAFRRANDERLDEIEKKAAADPLLDAKVDRINKRLETLSVSLSAPGGAPAAEPESKTAWSRFIRTGDEAALGEFKSLSTADGQGGFVAPVETENRIDAVRRDAGTGSAWIAGPTPIAGPPPSYAGAAQLLAFDLPDRAGITVGALLDPFEPVTVRWNGREATLDAPVRIGATLSDLPARPPHLRDRGTVLEVRLPGLALASLEDDAFLAGGNRFAVETATGWEIIAARDAVLSAPQTYRLSHLLRGLDGSDAFMDGDVPPGARILWLVAGLVTLSGADDWRGSTVEVLGKTDRREARPAELVWTDRNGWPLSPVHPRWNGAALSWTGRDSSFTDWTEDASHLRYRVRLVRGGVTETIDTALTALSVQPFDRAEIVQLAPDGRESLFPAALNVTGG